MLVLYPDIKPYRSDFLACFAPHEIYFEECGSPDGIPVLFVHGGPGGGCSACHEGIENILTRVMAEKGETFAAAAISAPVEKETPAEEGKMSDLQRIRTIMEVIDRVRPTLQADGGDCELVDIDGKTIYVKLTGACIGCQMAAMTMGGIQQQLIEALGEFVRLVQAEKKEELVGLGG